VENVLFFDIEYALGKTVEERLWTHVHYRVIDDYRKRISSVILLGGNTNAARTTTRDDSTSGISKISRSLHPLP
jgi:hypothetical protein